jgi:hypothetical protein
MRPCSAGEPRQREQARLQREQHHHGQHQEHHRHQLPDLRSGEAPLACTVGPAGHAPVRARLRVERYPWSLKSLVTRSSPRLQAPGGPFPYARQAVPALRRMRYGCASAVDRRRPTRKAGAVRTRLSTGAVVSGALEAGVLSVMVILATNRDIWPLRLQPYHRWAWLAVLILLLAGTALNAREAARQQLPTTNPSGRPTMSSTEPSSPPPEPTIIVAQAVLMTVIALLLAVSVGVLAALAIPSKPSTTVDVVSLDGLVADFRPFGFGPVERKRSFDLASLPGYYDQRQRALLRDLGLRRALAMSFPHTASDYNLEVRIFEFRGPTQARRSQRELSICFGLHHTSFDTPGVTGSRGTQCVAPVDGPIQEVTFTRAARLYKLKLTKGGAPLPRSTRMITDLSRREAAVAR